jgi:hypothetical protein
VRAGAAPAGGAPVTTPQVCESAVDVFALEVAGAGGDGVRGGGQKRLRAPTSVWYRRPSTSRPISIALCASGARSGINSSMRARTLSAGECRSASVAARARGGDQACEEFFVSPEEVERLDRGRASGALDSPVGQHPEARFWRVPSARWRVAAMPGVSERMATRPNHPVGMMELSGVAATLPRVWMSCSVSDWRIQRVTPSSTEVEDLCA